MRAVIGKMDVNPSQYLVDADAHRMDGASVIKIVFGGSHFLDQTVRRFRWSENAALAAEFDDALATEICDRIGPPKCLVRTVAEAAVVRDRRRWAEYTAASRDVESAPFGHRDAAARARLQSAEDAIFPA